MRGIAALAGAAACIGAGISAARRLERAARQAREWDGALMRLEGELARGGAPLPALMEQAAAEGADALALAARLLRENPALSPRQLLAGLAFPEGFAAGETRCLRDAVEGLFAPTLAQQRLALERARREWADHLDRRQKNADKNIRLYQSLGWLSGAAVYILLC